MGLPNVMNTGRSGMMAAKAAVATAGHNISNANTAGFTRQRVHTEQALTTGTYGRHQIGSGTNVARVDRVNDEYVEKQLRNGGRELSHLEEKDLMLTQAEDIFNEMGGEGLNRLMSKFFNQFRQLSTDPGNEAVRQAVREASQAMVSDFHRLRGAVDEVRQHIDNRIEGYLGETNMLGEQVKDLNIEILKMEANGSNSNDLQDKRDAALRKLASMADMNVRKEGNGAYVVDIKGVGPFVATTQVEKLTAFRSQADDKGKLENALDIKSSGSVQSKITHQLKGGKLGALLDVRDKTLSTIIDRLDDLAFSISESVNEIHRQGFTREGFQGVNFFKPAGERFRASEYLELSDEVQSNVNNIAAAGVPDAPADNRVAVAISGLQHMKLMNNGQTSVDSFYDSIVSDIGVASSRVKSTLNQQKDIQAQLNKIREQISGVSIDEETANLLQYQHAFDASAKIVAVADEMLKTILDLKR